MATLTEIVTRAFRRLGVFDALQAPSAEDMAAGKQALEAMVNAWEAEGLSGDVLPLDARFEQAVVAMLALRLAEEYGRAPGQVLVNDARAGWQALQAAYTPVPESRFDAALTGGVKADGAIRNVRAATVRPWQSATDYALYDHVTHGGQLYECVEAGTSGDTGPSGTGALVGDGTAAWTWRGVAIP